MNTRLALAILCLVTTAAAQSLRFTGGFTHDNLNVYVQLQGPTNRSVQIERLRHLTQTWQPVATAWLDGSGFAGLTLTNVHDNGFYAILRARTTNSSHLSTNGYGSVSGILGQNYSLVGNPFATNSPWMTFRNPPDGTRVLLYRNGGYSAAEYVAGVWLDNPIVEACEGMLVYNPSTNALRYIVSGVFVTNSFTYPIEAPLDLVCAPLFRIQGVQTNAIALNQRVDLLRTNVLGGDSSLPVVGNCVSNQVTDLFKLAGANGPTYTEYNLACNGFTWSLTNGWWTNVPLHLTEAFWIGFPTNRFWSFPARPIWP